MITYNSHTNKSKAANADWLEIIEVSRIGTAQKVRTVPLNTPEPKAIDLRDIKTADDLETIKKQDPFMYFSIPAVKSARMLRREVDISNLGASALTRSCISCPSRLETVQNECLPQRVTRTTRVSVECHPDLLLEDFMNEDVDMDDFEDDFCFWMDYLMKP